MKEKDLSLKTLILMGGALFSMHFGASSMIWPVTWGRESGSSIFAAYIGIFLTALFIPFLGYLALSRGKGTFLQITSRISPKFASLFCGFTIFVMGIFLIPRMSAAAWDAIVQLTGYQASSAVPIIAFSIVFYLITYWFTASRSKTVDRIGTILFPVLIVIVLGVIGKGVLMPISTWQPKTYETSAPIYGFLQGFATGELPCALIFGVIILNDLKNKGVKPENFNKCLIKVGIAGIGILSLTHLGHMLVGSLNGALFPGIMYSALYTQVVVELWGRIGGTCFSIALMFAVLTTAIGLAAACAEYFEEATGGKLSYKKGVTATLILSTVVSSFGLNTVMTYVGPLIDVTYPAAIVMTLYYAFAPNCIDNKRGINAMRYGVVISFLWGVFDVIIIYIDTLELNADILKNIYHMLPFSEVRLSWVPLAVICMVIGYFTCSPDKMEAAKAS